MRLSSQENINNEMVDGVVIHPEYKFSCTSYWQEKNCLLIYKADKDKVVKVHESNTSDLASNAKTAVKLIGPEITDKVMVSGGHTVIDLSHRLNVSDEVVSSTRLTFEIISELQTVHGKKGEFLVQLNDLYMEKDMDMDEASANKYREQALKPYIIPTKVDKIHKEYCDKLGRKIHFYYCAEKNLADRFKRHIKVKKKTNTNLFRKTMIDGYEAWNMVVNGEEIPVLVGDKPNCVAANAAMLRSIRHNIDNRKITDNFTSYIGVFPLCSINNVLNGYKAATALYNLDLPSYYVFSGKACY